MKVENSEAAADQVATSRAATPPRKSPGGSRSDEHLNTDHLLTDLKGRTISSGAVTVSAQAAKFLLNLASVVVLARLLTPRDFGLVAMVATVTTFLRVFKDAGLSTATVQREGITHAQVSNLFWINVGVSILSSLVLAASAPIIAWFYHNPKLVGITLFLSLTFLISGSAIQHYALLKRQMRFKVLALIDVASMAVGVAVAIAMGLMGFGYWSLVGQSLSWETSVLLLTWSASRWRPQWPSRRSGVGPLLKFGIHQTLASLISSVARGSDNLLIGRVYGSNAVGLYSRATALLMRPLEQLIMPINAVFLPALARLQSQPARYRSTFLRVYEAIALVAFLFTGLFLALAHPLTIVLLGRKWEQAAVIFAGFMAAALCTPLANACAWLFVSQGRGRDMLVAQSINSCGTFLSFLAGLPFGPAGVAIGFSISNLLVRLPSFYYSAGRSGPVRTADLWWGFFRHLPLWIVVFTVTSLLRMMLAGLAPLLQLLICAPAGILAGLALIWAYRPQREVALHLMATVRELKRKR